MGYREIHFAWADAELLIPLGAIPRIWEKSINLRVLGFHPAFSTYYDEDTKEAHGDFHRLIYQLQVRDLTTELQKTVTRERVVLSVPYSLNLGLMTSGKSDLNSVKSEKAHGIFDFLKIFSPTPTAEFALTYHPLPR